MKNFFQPFPPADIQHMERLLETGGDIVITTHARPDGDAAGSALGLWHFLHRRGVHATVIFPDPLDAYLAWLPGAGEALLANRDREAVKQKIASAGVIFCLDYSVISRTGEMAEWIYASPATRVLIDHHLWPEDAYNLVFHTVEACSTCELVLRLMLDLDDENAMTKECAVCLYTGIMTDTGSFRFSTTTAALHRAVGYLIESGVEVAPLHNRIYDNFSENRLRFLGYCLNEKMIVLPDFRTAYMCITREEMERFGVNDGDTEGLVNYNLSMGGVNLGVLIIERPDKVKLSFRSKGQFPCNILAGHFNGGGHHNASGGQEKMTLAEVEHKFLGLLPSFRDRLLY